MGKVSHRNTSYYCEKKWKLYKFPIISDRLSKLHHAQRAINFVAMKTKLYCVEICNCCLVGHKWLHFGNFIRFNPIEGYFRLTNRYTNSFFEWKNKVQQYFWNNLISVLTNTHQYICKEKNLEKHTLNVNSSYLWMAELWAILSFYFFNEVLAFRQWILPIGVMFTGL